MPRVDGPLFTFVTLAQLRTLIVSFGFSIVMEFLMSHAEGNSLRRHMRPPPPSVPPQIICVVRSRKVRPLQVAHGDAAAITLITGNAGERWRLRQKLHKSSYSGKLRLVPSITPPTKECAFNELTDSDAPRFGAVCLGELTSESRILSCGNDWKTWMAANASRVKWLFMGPLFIPEPSAVRRGRGAIAQPFIALSRPNCWLTRFG